MPGRHSNTAVIFAPNPKNLGMYSVDLAGYELLQTMTDHVDFFAEYESNVGGFTYGSMMLHRHTSAKQMVGYDKIIYWGDFTTSFPYAKRDYFGRTGKMFFPYSKSLIKLGLTKKLVQRRAISHWEKLYLPQFRDKAYYSIGQNFQTMSKAVFDSLPDTTQDRYRQFRSILPRDSASLENLNLMFSAYSPRPPLQQICDLAFLLKRPPRLASARGKNKKNVGVYFRRSKIKNIGNILDAISRYANVVPFADWIDSNLDYDLAFAKNVSLMRECDVIVSDTYHFLINALREGCPVIGLGNAESEQVSTTGDFKKKVLFADTGLSEFYLEMSGGFLDEKHLDQTLRLIRSINQDYWLSYRVDRDMVVQQIKGALAV
jgi:hypothetical protein